MNIKYFVPLISILLIVSVSGCVDFPGFEGMFGSGTGTIVEQTPDIIITKDLNVIPNPPILAGNEFSVSFVVKNQDSTETIEPLTAKLYNWGVCTLGFVEDTDYVKSTDLTAGTTSKWVKTGSSYYTKKMTMFPQQEELIEFPFTAPENSKIGSIETDCQIKWLFEYNYNSRSQDDFTVLSKDRITELSRAGEKWMGSNMAQYVGAGPIKLYFNWKTPMPVQTGSSIQFSIQAIDKGVGIYSKIISSVTDENKDDVADCSTCGLSIKVPKEWLLAGYTNYNDALLACTNKFTFSVTSDPLAVDSGSGNWIFVKNEDDGATPPVESNPKVPLGYELDVDEDGYVIYYSVEDVPFIKRETPEIICRFKAPDLGEGVPERSYFVSAEITDYTYKLTGEKAVHIKPTV